MDKNTVLMEVLEARAMDLTPTRDITTVDTIAPAITDREAAMGKLVYPKSLVPTGGKNHRYIK